MAYDRDKYKVPVKCISCPRTWMKRKAHIKIWSGRCMSCAKKAYIVTPEHKLHVSLSMKGRTFSEEHLKHLSLAQRGEKGSNWQGGRTVLSQIIRSLSLYRAWRFGVFSKDEFSCVSCGRMSSGDLQADHIKPFSVILRENNINSVVDAINCPLLWDISNGRTLCVQCHKQTDTYAGKLNRKLVNMN